MLYNMKTRDYSPNEYTFIVKSLAANLPRARKTT